MSIENSRNNKTKDSIVVAGVPEHFNLPWHLAIESGQFEDHGLNVVFDEVPGGTGEMTQRLSNRDCDVSVVLAEGGVAALLNGASGWIVKTFVDSTLLWGIHVSEKSDITQPEQIENSRYAISRHGSGSHLMAIVDASERGWNTDSMNFVEVGGLNGARKALAENSVDVFFWERFTTSPLVRSGEFKRLSDRAADWPAFVICATDEMVHARREELRLMLEILNNSCRDLMQSPNACEIIARRYCIELEEVESWFQLTRWNTGLGLNKEPLERIKNYLNRLGIISENSVRSEELWFNL